MKQKRPMRLLEARDEVHRLFRRDDAFDHETALPEKVQSARASILEEAKRFRAIADEKILGLLIMVEHHLVSLAAYP